MLRGVGCEVAISQVNEFCSSMRLSNTALNLSTVRLSMNTKYDAIERAHETSSLLHQQVGPDVCDHADIVTKHPGSKAAKHDVMNTLVLKEEQDLCHALVYEPLDSSSRVQVGPVPGTLVYNAHVDCPACDDLDLIWWNPCTHVVSENDH